MMKVRILCLVLVVSLCLITSRLVEAALINAGTQTLFDFKKVGAGVKASQTFNIKNVSTLNPVGYNIVLLPAPDSPFSVAPVSGTILPGKSVEITISVVSSTTGSFAKELQIHAKSLAKTQDITGWQLRVNIVPDKPDLHPDISVVSATATTTQGQGNTDVTVKTTIQNLGVKTSSACDVTISVDNSVEKTTGLNPIDAGSSTNLISSFTTQKKGPGHVIKVVVDSNGTNDELDETNNTDKENKDFP